MGTFSSSVLYEEPGHRFIHLGWEEKEEQGVVQTNQYIIVHGNEVVLLDPGGAHVFPRVLANVAEIVNISDVTNIFYSHQDPDVSSGVALWLSIADRAKVHISSLWIRFLPHFGIYDQSRINPLKDTGEEIRLRDGYALKTVPSHFLHSTGCFSLYDPKSKILFSGDIGAAVFPQGKRYPVVEDFDAHLPYMEGFHRRYMSSNKACSNWVERVSSLELRGIAPQHGAYFPEDQVPRFLNWFRQLRCGVDILEEFVSSSKSLRRI
jgi:flavorubredoxin